MNYAFFSMYFRVKLVNKRLKIELKKVIMLNRHSSCGFTLMLNNIVDIWYKSFYCFCIKCQLYFHTSEFIYFRNWPIIEEKLDLMGKMNCIFEISGLKLNHLLNVTQQKLRWPVLSLLLNLIYKLFVIITSLKC